MTLRSFRILLLALAAGLPAAAADLRFHPAGAGVFHFDTGVLEGTFRKDGRSIGLLPVVHKPTGTELAGSVGLFGIYRMFANGKRYGDGLWNWPSQARALENGAVEVRWPAVPERPFEVVALYRWSGPASLDIAITVRAEDDLRAFEAFLASYLGKTFTDTAVLTRDGRLTPADRAQGIWQMFPRDAASAARILDGRWKFPPSPVDWVIRPEYQRPLGVRSDPASGVAVAIMSTARDCFAVATPHQGERHYSTYLSLFGRDLKKGETARARARLVVLSKPQESELRKLRLR